MTTTFSSEDYERKITALLAKAESSDNEEEARALSEKAEDLMVRWGVDAATLVGKVGQKREEIVTHHFGDFGSTMQPANLRLAYAIVLGLGNLRAFQVNRGNRQFLVVIGFESDVHRAQLLVTSMRLQATSALRAWWRTDQHGWMTRAEQTAARRQFVVSFGVAVQRRLAAQRTRVVAEAGTGTELAIRDRRSLVDQWFDDNIGNLKKGRGMKGSWHGAAEGREAGQNAQLDGTAIRRGERKQL